MIPSCSLEYVESALFSFCTLPFPSAHQISCQLGTSVGASSGGQAGVGQRAPPGSIPTLEAGALSIASVSGPTLTLHRTLHHHRCSQWKHHNRGHCFKHSAVLRPYSPPRQRAEDWEIHTDAISGPQAVGTESNLCITGIPGHSD